jgi:hypothetical protein
MCDAAILFVVRYEAPFNFEPNGGDGQLNVDGTGVHDRNANDRDTDEPNGGKKRRKCVPLRV